MSNIVGRDVYLNPARIHPAAGLGVFYLTLNKWMLAVE